MKRFISLVTYTVVIIGGSYFFKDNPDFPIFMYMSTIIVSFGIIGMIVSGMAGGAYGVWNIDGKWGITGDLDYVKAQEGYHKKTFTNLSSILSFLYIIIPLIVSILLFC